jgi:predicted short-subunit dehydrogenase-like oxidoreductase (DUF2520 family)
MTGPVVVLGRGRAGTVVARALARAGVEVRARTARTAPEPTDLEGATVVVIAAPDDALPAVAQRLAGRLPSSTIVLHLSGATSPDVLRAAGPGLPVGAFHPLQTFADADSALTLLPATTFFGWGDPAALVAMEALAGHMGARFRRRDDAADPALYHAGAVAASNLVVALVAIARRLAIAGGVAPEEALPALLGLLHGTMKALESRGLPHALTGPASRGDLHTLERHVQALGALPDADPLAAYRALSRAAIDLARAAGTVDEATAATARKVLDSSTREMGT